MCVEDSVCLENTTIKFGFCYTSKLDLFPPRGEAARGCFESRGNKLEREGEEESPICSDLVLEQINWTGRRPLLSVLDISVHALIRCMRRVHP